MNGFMERYRQSKKKKNPNEISVEERTGKDPSKLTAAEKDQLEMEALTGRRMPRRR